MRDRHGKARRDDRLAGGGPAGVVAGGEGGVGGGRDGGEGLALLEGADEVVGQVGAGD